MDSRIFKMSGIGKVVMYLCCYLREIRVNKKIVGKFVSKYCYYGYKNEIWIEIFFKDFFWKVVYYVMELNNVLW